MTTSNETPETETTEDAPKQSEPIDAEFEPAQGPEPQTEKTAKSGVGMATVAAWSIGAALAGGTIGVIGSGSSTIDTAKFAPAEIRTDIEDLSSTQTEVSDKLDKAWESIGVNEARLEGQVEQINAKLAAREESEAALRAEFDALMAQLDVLIGPEGEPAAPAGAAVEDGAQTSMANGAEPAQDGAGAALAETAPAKPPLQRLMERIDYLETRLAEADATPETTGQLKRALSGLSTRVEAVEAANKEYDRAIEKREQAIASLQSGLFNANQAIADVEDRVVTLAEEEQIAPEPAVAAEVDARIDALRAEIAALKTQAAASPVESLEAADPQEMTDAEDVNAAPTPTSSPGSKPIMAPVQPANASGAATAAAGEDAVLAEKDQLALKISAASLAVAKLDGDSANGKPFPSAWDALKKAMPDNANVDAVKAISRRGAPTLSSLRTGFSEVKATLDKRIQEEGKGDGWDWARQAFGGVVSVRRTDIEGDTPQAALNRIAKALDEADLAAAVENAEMLEGFSDTDFDAWLDGARARLTLETNIDAVREEILAKSAELAGRN